VSEFLIFFGELHFTFRPKSNSVFFLVAYQRFAPRGDSLLIRAAGAAFLKYAQTPQILTHPVNDRTFDHQSQ
jgi:hypothetical protein